MEKINTEKMKKVKGGSVNWGLVAGLSAFASFVIGLIDGLMNPQKCN